MSDSSLLSGKVAIVTGAGGGIGRAYSRALAVQADVADEESTNRMAATAAGRFGSIDVLVNNAALMAEIVGKGTLTTMPLDLWHRTVAINLTGPMLCTRAVVPYMKRRGYGKVVNQTSGGAFLPSGAYGATKLGLASMTMSLAQELAPFGIRVNAIAPGSVNTQAGAIAAPPQFRPHH